MTPQHGQTPNAAFPIYFNQTWLRTAEACLCKEVQLFKMHVIYAQRVLHVGIIHVQPGSSLTHDQVAYTSNQLLYEAFLNALNSAQCMMYFLSVPATLLHDSVCRAVRCTLHVHVWCCLDACSLTNPPQDACSDPLLDHSSAPDQSKQQRTKILNESIYLPVK